MNQHAAARLLRRSKRNQTANSHPRKRVAFSSALKGSVAAAAASKNEQAGSPEQPSQQLVQRPITNYAAGTHQRKHQHALLPSPKKGCSDAGAAAGAAAPTASEATGTAMIDVTQLRGFGLGGGAAGGGALDGGAAAAPCMSVDDPSVGWAPPISGTAAAATAAGGGASFHFAHPHASHFDHRLLVSEAEDSYLESEDLVSDACGAAMPPPPSAHAPHGRQAISHRNGDSGAPIRGPWGGAKVRPAAANGSHHAHQHGTHAQGADQQLLPGPALLHGALRAGGGAGDRGDAPQSFLMVAGVGDGTGGDQLLQRHPCHMRQHPHPLQCEAISDGEDPEVESAPPPASAAAAAATLLTPNPTAAAARTMVPSATPVPPFASSRLFPRNLVVEDVAGGIIPGANKGGGSRDGSADVWLWEDASPGGEGAWDSCSDDDDDDVAGVAMAAPLPAYVAEPLPHLLDPEE